MPGSELIKNFIPVEEGPETFPRRMSENILSNSSALKNDIKAPKDSLFVEYITQRGVYAGILFYSSSD